MTSRDPLTEHGQEELDAAWGAAAESRERYDSRSRDEFEERAVLHVLKGLGSADSATRIRQRLRDLTGERDIRISFAALHHFVPDFPIRLGVAKLYYLQHTLTLETLFRRPQKSPVYRAFLDWAEEDVADDDRPRGLIFRLPGCPGVGNRAVLHTYAVPYEDEQTRITFGVKDRRNLALYTMEPLDQLLTALARTRRDWA
jgi:hypothetical protein